MYGTKRCPFFGIVKWINCARFTLGIKQALFNSDVCTCNDLCLSMVTLKPECSHTHTHTHTHLQQALYYAYTTCTSNTCKLVTAHVMFVPHLAISKDTSKTVLRNTCSNDGFQCVLSHVLYPLYTVDTIYTPTIYNYIHTH